MVTNCEKITDSPILTAAYGRTNAAERAFILDLDTHGPREEEMVPPGHERIWREGLIKIAEGSCFLTDAGRLLARYIDVRGSPVLVCETCGGATTAHATKRCDSCWELERNLTDYLKRGGTKALAFVEGALKKTPGSKLRIPRVALEFVCELAEHGNFDQHGEGDSLTPDQAAMITKVCEHFGLKLSSTLLDAKKERQAAQRRAAKRRAKKRKAARQ